VHLCALLCVYAYAAAVLCQTNWHQLLQQAVVSAAGLLCIGHWTGLAVTEGEGEQAHLAHHQATFPQQVASVACKGVAWRTVRERLLQSAVAEDKCHSEFLV
jgi:hypothetical protein